MVYLIVTFQSVIQGEEEFIVIKLVFVIGPVSSILVAHCFDFALCHKLQSLIDKAVQVLDLLAVYACRALDDEGSCKWKKGRDSHHVRPDTACQPSNGKACCLTFRKIERLTSLERECQALQNLLQQPEQ